LPDFTAARVRHARCRQALRPIPIPALKQEKIFYMKLRPFITLLLTIILAANALGQQPQTTEDMPVEKGEEKLTTEEEREAREIAALLNKRWKETQDIRPLIKEHFVTDFADRLRYEPQVLYFAEIKPELFVPENRDEMQRHYVAMTNFVHLVFRLYETYGAGGISVEGQDGPELYEIIPAAVWNMLRDNPTMYAVLAEEMGENARAQQAEPVEQDTAKREQAKTVKTIEELRSLTTTLEHACVLLRDHLKTLPSTLPMSEQAKEQKRNTDSNAAGNDATDDDDALRPRLHILSRDFFGYPAGTRMICFNILMFHVDLVRVGNRLRVLSIYLQTD
jgi:hypothetical protein